MNAIRLLADIPPPDPADPGGSGALYVAIAAVVLIGAVVAYLVLRTRGS